MNRIIIMSIVLMIVFGITPVYAATVVVTNHFYAHANEAGTFYFKDKNGRETMYGDNLQMDAIIKGVDVMAQGMGSGDQIILTTSSGATHTITPGTQLSLNVPANQYIKIAIVKTGTNEVYARMDNMYTLDASDGGTNVHYSYSVNFIPTQYGELGSGTGGGSGGTVDTVTGSHYYFPPRDSYKYDYTPPAGIARYELHFLDANGSTMYKRDYEQTPTGIHYLTCNGTYEMKYFDSSGAVVAKSPNMVTTQIQNPTCASLPGNGAGFNDISVTETATGIEWQPVTGATDYEVYQDGQLVGSTPGTTMETNKNGGAVTVVAKNGSGEVIGQTDITPTSSPTNPTDPGGGCNGCTLITDMLSCPAWDDYMGEWGKVIRDNVPPAPDWQNVANIMRDTIVPAMGAELVARAPEIAEIIADEFQSREKPVSPPPAAPVFNPTPNLPVMQDLPEQIPFDVNSNVPSFEPDFTESEPFVIPDPSSITYSDVDKGYGYADPAAPLPEKEYVRKEQPTQPAPSYTPTQPEESEAPPAYQQQPSGAPPKYNSGESGTAPEYNMGTPTTPPGGSDPHEYYQFQE